jgi:excisionase family DNA binding protein
VSLPRFITAAQLADLIGRTPLWVTRAAADGRIPSHKIGDAVRFSEDEIAEWLDTCRRGERVRPSSQLHAIGGQQ